MKIWEVVRNAEKNFTDNFKEVYDSTQTYKNLSQYNLINNNEDKEDDSEEVWDLESSQY